MASDACDRILQGISRWESKAAASLASWRLDALVRHMDSQYMPITISKFRIIVIFIFLKPNDPEAQRPGPRGARIVTGARWPGLLRRLLGIVNSFFLRAEKWLASG